MDRRVLKSLLLLQEMLSTCLFGQQAMAQDSTFARTMRSVILYEHWYGRGHSGDHFFVNGQSVSEAQVKAACMTFDSSAAVYAKYEKMKSHNNRAAWIFLIGEGTTLALLPLFTQPAIYNSQFWQNGIVILAVGTLVYAVTWSYICSGKVAHAVRLYDRSVFTRAGIPTRRMHHRIKCYYRHVFGIY